MPPSSFEGFNLTCPSHSGSILKNHVNRVSIMPEEQNTIIVTGGAGFIGSSFVDLLMNKGLSVVVIDSLTYAGRLENLKNHQNNPLFQFEKLDICNQQAVFDLFTKHKARALVNFAAESHVDNSISGPRPFIDTNITGVFALLEAARAYWQNLNDSDQSQFRYLQVSTDEVFGELGDVGKFTETTPYKPSSPYSASKAAGDHLVRAWHHTYGLPTLVTNCSNNYGPRQFPEKLIPRMITCALNGETLPVYGKGENVRDWIHVEDHCQGVWLALQKGEVGETYCFGGNSERKNLDVVKRICHTLDELKARSDGKSYEDQIGFVTDRAGHDWRYAIDDSKAEKQLGFTRKYRNFEDGLTQTISWYLDNGEWLKTIKETSR